MIWIGRAFISKMTGWSWESINTLYYTEFIKLIEFYADPQKEQKNNTNIRPVGDLDQRLEEIKEKDKELVERGKQRNRRR